MKLRPQGLQAPLTFSKPSLIRHIMHMVWSAEQHFVLNWSFRGTHTIERDLPLLLTTEKAALEAHRDIPGGVKRGQGATA